MGCQIRIPVAIRRLFGSHGADAAIGALARVQHGVASRVQLLELGLSESAIDRRIRLGRLCVVYRGVYAVGHANITREGRFMAAVLATDAVLSHDSAAALWAMRPARGHVIHVTAPRGGQRPGIRFHRATLAPNDITRKHGIPVTTPERTLLDYAATATKANLERALREAEYQNLMSPASLARQIRANPAHRGTKKLSATTQAQAAAPGRLRSDLEMDLLDFLRTHKLPLPQCNVPMEIAGMPIEADFLWPNHRLIAEIDGRAGHATAGAFERDRERDRKLQAAGWRTIRITERHLQDGPALLADFSQLLANPPAHPRAA